VTRVQEYIKERLQEGPIHITLIDPDKQDPKKAAEMVKLAEEGGTHLILVGGTMGVDLPKLEKTLEAVGGITDLPVVLFPAEANVISGNADAILFMSLLNSKDVKYVIREAASASIEIQRLGLEPLSVGYIVISPGGLVGEVGDVELIPRDDPSRAMDYAAAAQMMGMNFVYLEAGSGVGEPIPPEFIGEIRKLTRIPLIVGGGIKCPECAGNAVRNGADIIVTGTLIETDVDLSSSLKDMIKAMEAGWRSRSW
jgi:phosphoglycerol geranylgeranyltransferase